LPEASEGHNSVYLITGTILTKERKIMKRKLVILLIAVLGAVALITSTAAANPPEITYSWFACDNAPGHPSCPNTSYAANGESIEIRGTGELIDGTKSATGGGTFVHKDPYGLVLGGGTWEATELLNFKTYGPSPATPADWRTGMARMRVDLLVGGVKVAEGIISIGCRLPEVKLPPSVFEGVTLNVLGGLNFNQVETEGDMPPGGPTLFMEQ
jgi:hypothetical protein